jgi:serine/threonine protein kinase
MAPVADFNLATFFTLPTAENKQILRRFFGCLASAPHYLHSIKIRHRDIKPENILVKPPNVFLTDFGISLDWENLTRSTTTEDTAKSLVYCAPEVAAYRPRNSSSDVWSLGCIFFEMFTVIQDHTIGEARDFVRDQSDSYCYSENVAAAQQWIAKLQAVDSGLLSDTIVVNWIKDMLLEEPSTRISARRLYTEISSHPVSDSTRSNPYCGECCTADTHSVSDSGSDRDPLENSAE